LEALEFPDLLLAVWRQQVGLSSLVMRCDLSRRRLVRVRQQIKIIGYLFGFIAPEIATELAVQLRRFAR